jgi:hypothetical protein
MDALLKRPSDGAESRAAVRPRAIVILRAAKDLVHRTIRRFVHYDRLWPVATPQLIGTSDDDGNS